MKKFFLIIFVIFNIQSTFGQCDPEMEYTSSFYHSNLFAFIQSNNERIIDKEGNFYELLFFQDSIKRNSEYFISPSDQILYTSGIAITKSNEKGEIIFTKSNFLRKANLPTRLQNRNNASLLMLHEDTLLLFTTIFPGEYITNEGTLNIEYIQFVCLKFSTTNGNIHSISPIIEGKNNHLFLINQNVALTKKDNIIYFAFNTPWDVVNTQNNIEISPQNDERYLILGAYNLINGYCEMKKLAQSKRLVVPNSITEHNGHIFISGFYSDTVKLGNDDQLIPDPNPFNVNGKTDGFVLKSNNQFEIKDYNIMTSRTSSSCVVHYHDFEGNLHLLLNNSGNYFSTLYRNSDTSYIAKFGYNYITLNNELEVVNNLVVGKLSNEEDEFLRCDLIKLNDGFVLIVASNQQKFSFEDSTYFLTHLSTGISQFHFYISDNDFTQYRFFSDSSFSLTPIQKDSDYIYFQGYSESDIKGSFNFDFPSDNLFNYHTFSNKVCLSKKVSIDKINSSKFKIYPNPTHTSITIENESIISNIQILDLMGKVVYQNESVNKNSITLDISQFTNGLYIIKYLSDGKWNIGKVVKQ